jgi:hypothetical protein
MKNYHFSSLLAVTWPLALLLVTPQALPSKVEGVPVAPECKAELDLPKPTIGGGSNGMRIPACPEECKTLEFESQIRCVDAGIWHCETNNHQWQHKRKRWKWKCTNITYVSCGTWFDFGCCAQVDPGPSCAGNSGLHPCAGIPPQ